MRDCVVLWELLAHETVVQEQRQEAAERRAGQRPSASVMTGANSIILTSTHITFITVHQKSRLVFHYREGETMAIVIS
jgi:hypothetical protein